MEEENTKIPEILINAKEREWLHVFLINGPITAMVSRMIIDAFGIKNNNVIAVSIRNSDTSLIDPDPIILNPNLFDRLMMRLFRANPLSSYVLETINKRKQNFLLYASWVHRESITNSEGKKITNSHPSVDQILNSKFCMGHSYIEEGQLSYRPNKPYPPENRKTYHAEYLKKLKGGYFRDDEDRLDNRLLHRDDAQAFIGILPDVFPAAQEEKRIVLKNFDDLKKYYKPALLGIKTIGLTCSERRLTLDQREPMLKKLIEKIPDGSVIKLHPSFSADITKRKEMESILTKIAPKSISLCSDEVILEIEMLYEPKTLIGSLTSLSKYAEALGSEFIGIPLY